MRFVVILLLLACAHDPAADEALRADRRRIARESCAAGELPPWLDSVAFENAQRRDAHATAFGGGKAVSANRDRILIEREEFWRSCGVMQHPVSPSR